MQPKNQRILIIGSAGAGKSTLSRKLGELWNLPVVHLDALFWQPGWKPIPRPEFINQVKAEMTKSKWLIDGNYDSTLEMRAEYADLIIFLDFSRSLCLYRACKRAWTYRGTTRPDMGKDCLEKMDWEFMRWIWRFPKDAKPEIVETLLKTPAKVITLKSPKELDHWFSLQSVAEKRVNHPV
jgi:adenylate kinase family enzyme